jgi:hypothetical protein
MLGFFYFVCGSVTPVPRPRGAPGDPAKGTKEKGRKMTEVLVKCIVDSIKALDACGWNYKSSNSAL